MMPNITRGDRAMGLMSYLVGAGRSNEHTDPHLVAGDDVVMAWHSDNALGGESAKQIAKHLDAPQKAFGTQVSQGHLWHCSLSLRAEEGALTDQKWQEIAEDFIAGMEFDSNQGTKAPCRWVAVHHGTSKRGNDHIHLVVNLIREDGTKAVAHRDFVRAQNVARALEVKHGLEQLESRTVAVATRGYHPAERDAQARARAVAIYSRTPEAARTPWAVLPKAQRDSLAAAQLDSIEPRYRLAVAVRGYATASRTEDEFVRRARRGGLLIRPRFADGRSDVIVGYSVARRPVAGERPIWYGGGHLARDLTLTRLRDGWDDNASDATLAAAEWRAAFLGQRCTASGRETFEATPDGMAAHSARVAKLIDNLHDVSDADSKYWAVVSHQTAGALAAWSNATERVPGDLAQLAHIVSKSAQTYDRPPRASQIDTLAINGAAMLLASAMRGGQGKAAQAALVRQMVRLVEAVIKAMLAHQQLRQAEVARDFAQSRLASVESKYIAAASTPAVEPAGYGSTRQKVQPLKPEAQAILDRLERASATGTQGARQVLPADLERVVKPTIKTSADHGRE